MMIGIGFIIMLVMLLAVVGLPLLIIALVAGGGLATFSRRLTDDRSASGPLTPAAPSPSNRRCPTCGRGVQAEWNVCPSCGAKLI
jgi:hypothetical protein